jgi:lauroyl/myristoyl acyltransferase
MTITSIANSAAGPFLGVLIGKVLTQRQSYALADAVSRRLAANRDSDLCRNIRANQSVIRGLRYDSRELDDAVLQVLQNLGRGYVDWFATLSKTKEERADIVRIDPGLVENVRASRAAGHGLVMCGAHLSSFNMIMFGIEPFGEEADIQALTFANPGRGYQAENYLRNRIAAEITPISPDALRKAMRRLKNAGMIMTAVDRPDPQGEQLTFFGRQTTLPTGHARIAIRAGAYIIAGICKPDPDGGYIVTGSPVIRPEDTGDVRRDASHAAQQVLDFLEREIRSHPDLWMMFYPLWPEVIPGPAS